MAHGIGQDFRGVYNIYENEINLFNPNKTNIENDVVSISDLSDSKLDDFLGEQAEELRGDLELVDGVYDPFIFRNTWMQKRLPYSLVLL